LKKPVDLTLPIIWIYQALNVLKLFKFYVKRILKQLVSCRMKTEKDYEEFLELLNNHKVRYCIIGSYALSFHARPRYTKDIDILVDASAKNAKKILSALNDFGFGSLNLRVEDFSEKGNIIQLGYEPVRIDIITSLEGLNFSDIWEKRVQGPYGSQMVNFIDRQNLIKSKKISNRIQDKADLELLKSEE